MINLFWFLEEAPESQHTTKDAKQSGKQDIICNVLCESSGLRVY